MATYTLTSTIPAASAIKVGDVLECPYSGTYKSLELPAGVYHLQCWGAQGGYRGSSTYGGMGGFAEGSITLDEPTMVYLYAGGSGNTGGTSGGFNGGGRKYSGYGGGGASDVRIGANSLYARVLVAGGGGSDGASNKAGGNGGGPEGMTTPATSFGTGGFGGGRDVSSPNLGGTSYFAGLTATQPSGYTYTSQTYTYNGFGWGGCGTYSSDGYGGAGGGGWFGGVGVQPDNSVDDDKGGGGGSGFIWANIFDYPTAVPTGWLLTPKHYLNVVSYARDYCPTCGGVRNVGFSTTSNTWYGHATYDSHWNIPDSQTSAIPTVAATSWGTFENGHAGNGHVRITCLKLANGIYGMTVKIEDAWKNCKHAYFKRNGNWIEVADWSNL